MQLARTGDFQGRFDGAVVGVVRSETARADGRTVVVVAVEQSFGPRLDGDVDILGWLPWTQLEPGGRYFLPYVVRGRGRGLLLCGDGPQRLPPVPASPTNTPTLVATPGSPPDDTMLLAAIGLAVLVGGALVLAQISRSRGGIGRPPT